jgi:hypothetical protein
MRYSRLKVFVALLAVVLLGVMQVEAGLSFIGSVQVAGGSVNASGSIAGFGQADGEVTVTLTVSGSGDAICINNGQNEVPGHSNIPISVVMQGPAEVDAASNGRYNFALTAHFLPDPDAAGCPNAKNWTLKIVNGTLSVTVSATDGVAHIEQSFTCDIVDSTSVTNCV